ncbi:hypothetical protein DVH24_034934 [Malus domestica]|uniref:Uncharacterized protein n=1 Tax=Malus domestica TaxID=3750 RepID=A0A498IJS7_MALDO|nr:hypothetical protein DVH24_034934 [Malus domestica]
MELLILEEALLKELQRWFKLKVEGWRKGSLKFIGACGILRNSFGAWHVGFCVNLEPEEILNANKEVADSVIVVQLILHGATNIILLVN